MYTLIPWYGTDLAQYKGKKVNSVSGRLKALFVIRLLQREIFLVKRHSSCSVFENLRQLDTPKTTEKCTLKEIHTIYGRPLDKK